MTTEPQLPTTPVPELTPQQTRTRLLAALVAIAAGATAVVIAILLLKTALS
jgi:hypothetical protein